MMRRKIKKISGLGIVACSSGKNKGKIRTSNREGKLDNDVVRLVLHQHEN